MLLEKLLVVFVALYLNVESCEIKKIHSLVKENNEILKGDYEYDAKNKIRIEKGKLLAVIPEWGPNWKISFDLKIKSFNNGGSPYGSILRFTNQDLSEDTAGFNGDVGVGRRTPALFTGNIDNCGGYTCDFPTSPPHWVGFHYAFNLNNTYDEGGNIGNFYENSPDLRHSGKWYSFDIEQKFEAFEWINTIKVRNESGPVWTSGPFVVTTPNVYYNVSVFAGDNFYNPCEATIKNLQYSSGTSSFAYP